jgi:hypothetical protein
MHNFFMRGCSFFFWLGNVVLEGLPESLNAIELHLLFMECCEDLSCVLGRGGWIIDIFGYISVAILLHLRHPTKQLFDLVHMSHII